MLLKVRLGPTLQGWLKAYWVKAQSTIAIKLLLGSRKKFMGMLIGATFSAFIIMQQPSVYQGVTDRLVAQIQAIAPVDLWIMSQQSFTFDHPTSFNAMDLYRIRSLPGVQSATPLYRTWEKLTHLKTQKKLNWEIIGVDPQTLIGLPKTLLKGKRSNILQPNAIFIDGYSLKLLEHDMKTAIQLGDRFTIGRQTWKIAGITTPLRTYSDEPVLYVANNHLPNREQTPLFILVTLQPSAHLETVVKAIQESTGHLALTPQQFMKRSNTYFKEKTPIIMGFVSISIIGFTIGLIMMWQLFHNFILSHLPQFGMLKMLGVSNASLMGMVLCQAGITGGIGYVSGLLLTLLFGLLTQHTVIAFHFTAQIALWGALGILFVILFSSYFCISTILRFDTIELFREPN